MSIRNAPRNTRQRQVILEELQKLTSHPTAAGLYEIVRLRLPQISLGTVYRNLDLLAGLGKIKKLDLCGHQARFDGNLQKHDHIRCVRCGRVDDMFNCPLDPSNTTFNDWGGYEVIGHRLEFFGICPCCQQSQKEQKPC
jgi:Fe2+ or Zn2+ uptake regulation protein